MKKFKHPYYRKGDRIRFMYCDRQDGGPDTFEPFEMKGTILKVYKKRPGPEFSVLTDGGWRMIMSKGHFLGRADEVRA